MNNGNPLFYMNELMYFYLSFDYFLSASILKLTEEDLLKVPYLQCCTLEAIRMHPVGIITRRVVTEFSVKVRIII